MLIIFILKAAHIQNNTKYNYDQQSNGKIRRRVNYTTNLKDGGEGRVEGGEDLLLCGILGCLELSRGNVIYKPPPATRQEQHQRGRGTNQTSNLSAGVLSAVLSGAHTQTGICGSCLLED